MHKLLIGLLVFGVSTVSFSEETTPEKIHTETNKAIDGTKETVRDAQDKACETINGKLECAPKKMKHKARTLKDKTKTKAEELKDKAD